MKVVTVHRGARDSYQVACALQETGMLEALVTDFYWPSDRGWAEAIELALPLQARQAVHARYARGLPSGSVRQCWFSGSSSLAASKFPQIPFAWRRDLTRWCDRVLGQTAARIATKKQAALLSYSYYAHSAFSNCHGSTPRILFQLHPHPASVRAILARERRLNPDCAASLDSEWELSLPEADFDRLVQETTMAEHWLVASRFSKATLVEAGIPEDRIALVPYGIDAARFEMKPMKPSPAKPLNLLFVGTLGQRKGIKYLLQALDLLPPQSVNLTVCGRPVDDLAIFSQKRANLQVHAPASRDRLRLAYREADAFVFPSLAEGFGHVLLEAMASGLPILSTTRTAAPDLIRHGQEGFIVPPADAPALAECIEQWLRDPALVRRMGAAARKRAEQFTWERFRRTLAGEVQRILSGVPDPLDARNRLEAVSPCLDS